MAKTKSMIYVFISALLILTSSVGCGRQTVSTEPKEKANVKENVKANEQKEEIKLHFWATGPSGSWYPLATAITEKLKKNMANLNQVSIESGGAVSNVVAINEGKGQIGFSQAMPAFDGYNGSPPFKGKNQNIRYVMSLFPHYMHIAVNKGSGINKIEDIKGKRINVGPKGLTTEVLTQQLLKLYGMSLHDMASVEYLSFADSVEQMKNGRLDVLFWNVSIPFAVLNDLSESRDIVYLPIPNDKIQKLTSVNNGLFSGVIKTGSYKGMDKDVKTINTPLVIIAHKDAPEDLVYQTTKTVFAEFESLKQISPPLKVLTTNDFLGDIGIPMHPGAQKFFKEKGLLK